MFIMKSNNQVNELWIVLKKYSYLFLFIDIMISNLKYLEFKYDNLFYWESEFLLLIFILVYKILIIEEYFLQQIVDFGYFKQFSKLYLFNYLLGNVLQWRKYQQNFFKAFFGVILSIVDVVFQVNLNLVTEIFDFLRISQFFGIYNIKIKLYILVELQ